MHTRIKESWMTLHMIWKLSYRLWVVGLSHNNIGYTSLSHVATYIDIIRRLTLDCVVLFSLWGSFSPAADRVRWDSPLQQTAPGIVTALWGGGGTCNNWSMQISLSIEIDVGNKDRETLNTLKEVRYVYSHSTIYKEIVMWNLLQKYRMFLQCQLLRKLSCLRNFNPRYR